MERQENPLQVEFYFDTQEPLKNRGNFSSADRHVCEAAIPAPVSCLLRFPTTRTPLDPCTPAIKPLVHPPRARYAFLRY